MRKFSCVFLFSYGASQQRPCVRIGLTHAYLSHVKMTLANAKSVNRQTLENVVRNAASEFTRRTAIASLASLRSLHLLHLPKSIHPAEVIHRFFLDIVLHILYIKIHTHIEYSINNIENSNTIQYTLIYDFNNSVDISYNHIKTSKSYVTIGETTVITFTDAEKTSNEHIMTSECYDTICESDPIGYMDATKRSYQHIETSEPYKTIGDTDIVIHIGVITEKLFETI